MKCMRKKPSHVCRNVHAFTIGGQTAQKCAVFAKIYAMNIIFNSLI